MLNAFHTGSRILDRAVVKSLLPLRRLEFFRRNGSFLAAVAEDYGKPLVLKTVERKAKLDKFEVRIKTEFSGLNMSDILMIKGEYDLKPKTPFIAGYEIAGKIIELGPNVKDMAVGDRVLCLNKEKFGAFAEECVSPYKDVWLLPPEVSFKTAAAIGNAYGLAYLALTRRADIKKGDAVIVTAAPGGMGLAALDVAANVYQSKVIAICATNEGCEMARKKGAWAALTLSEKKRIVSTVTKLTRGKGAKIIYEAVGGEIFVDLLDCIAHEGRVLVVGFASRVIPSIQTSLLLPRSFSLIGVSLSHYRLNANEIYRDAIADVIKIADDEYIDPTIAKIFPLEEINDAIEYMKQHKTLGKVVIQMPS